MRRKYLGVELNNKYIEQFNQYLKNNLQKGLKEYEINKLAPDQIQFETVIWQLRALKYGRVLLNSLEKTTGTNRLKVVVSQQDIRNGKIVVGYTFITTAPLIETIEALVQEFINSKPLKLYGILPVINYIEPGMINLQDYYMYSSTNSYSYIKKEGNLAKAKVFSKIKLDIDEKQYE